MKIITYLILILPLASLLIAASCGKSQEKEDANNNSPGKNKSVETSTARVSGMHTYNEGIKLARSNNRIVLVTFFADWCTYCRKMDRETFSDAAVKAILDSEYVAVRIHTDRPKQEKIIYREKEYSAGEFSNFMEIEGLPTALFIDRNENLITKIPGFVDKNVFLPLLVYIKDKCYEKNISFELYLREKSSCRNKS